ncbi:hypothetical protein Ae406Ps2_1547c [Pseudonocardia sp. Ae406_Ps2]|nr:hypothetical protein Ae406Ps2_1547c [Pseudonocardia sp. Ae406_Ps2]OLM06650.1 hypothetical protein Ae331Ps2_4360 [Pseudonocardia sp. Ae331_Ps2]OLM13404.1 hypothetical protein Ae505Ps2_3532 [Pseudonocardia sp. Ae505_Ps2]OLM23118.1 hypothetical protein Ae706Ps2_1551c [Pseudonocardia sp. Ae706_Ps2]
MYAGARPSVGWAIGGVLTASSAASRRCVGRCPDDARRGADHRCGHRSGPTRLGTHRHRPDVSRDRDR